MDKNKILKEVKELRYDLLMGVTAYSSVVVYQADLVDRMRDRAFILVKLLEEGLKDEW